MNARQLIAASLAQFNLCIEIGLDAKTSGKQRELCSAYAGQHFVTAYLLELLRRRDDVSASRAAAFLDDCGEVMAEWVGEWRTQLAAGQPMVLPGEVAMSDREA